MRQPCPCRPPSGRPGRRVVSAGGRRGAIPGQPRSLNSAISALIWLAPSPRNRLLSAMPMRFMISRARTLPTPGIDCSRSMTRSLATTSLTLDSAMTSLRLAPEFFSRFLTSALSRRAAAAFSRAALRCSGVNVGSATGVTSHRRLRSFQLDVAFLENILHHRRALCPRSVERLVSIVELLELGRAELFDLRRVGHLLKLQVGVVLCRENALRDVGESRPVLLDVSRSDLGHAREDLGVALIGGVRALHAEGVER